MQHQVQLGSLQHDIKLGSKIPGADVFMVHRGSSREARGSCSTKQKQQRRRQQQQALDLRTLSNRFLLVNTMLS